MRVECKSAVGCHSRPHLPNAMFVHVTLHETPP